MIFARKTWISRNAVPSGDGLGDFCCYLYGTTPQGATRVIAKVYGDTAQEAHNRARALWAMPQLAGGCESLRRAYAVGEANGGSVSWEDLDDAHGDAIGALEDAAGSGDPHNAMDWLRRHV